MLEVYKRVCNHTVSDDDRGVVKTVVGLCLIGRHELAADEMRGHGWGGLNGLPIGDLADARPLINAFRDAARAAGMAVKGRDA